jgi:hypothetical protein
MVEPMVREVGWLGIVPKVFQMLERMQSFWRGAKEKISCASKLLHFGVWKAGSSSDLISEVDAILTDIPLQTGYPPKRWRKSVDAMLRKKEGSFLIDYVVRTIVLFHADFNYLNKFVGHKMMWNAEFFGQLASDKFGSQSGHRAIEQAWNKMLSFDLVRQQRITATYNSSTMLQ